MLDSQVAANCGTLLATDTTSPNNYSSHYCTVDKYHDPNAAACTYRDGGLRVFNIKNPYNPSEIAYYKPPRGGRNFFRDRHLVAHCRPPHRSHATIVRWHRYKDEVHLWFGSQDNGFKSWPSPTTC